MLAPKSTCFCGKYQISLAEVLVSTVWLGLKVNTIPSKFERLESMKSAPFVLSLLDSAEEYIRPGLPTSLDMCEILNLQRRLQVTDPSDRVYGMLGLLNPHGSEVAEQTIKIDYNEAAYKVFRDATRIALAEHLNRVEFVLRRISHRSDDEITTTAWASWIPRWDRPYIHEQDPSLLGQSPPFQSSARSLLSLELLLSTKGTDVLTMHGIRVGIITGHTSHLTGDIAANAQQYLSWLTNVRSVAGTSSHHCGIAISAGVNEQQVRVPEEYGQHLTNLMDFIRKEGRIPPSMHTMAPDTQPHIQHIARYDQAVLVASENRCFFSTTSGHVGIGPKVILPGDIVAIIYGSRMPFVLRQSGEYYRMLGDSYVHGIMDGEAVPVGEASGTLHETFTIR